MFPRDRKRLGDSLKRHASPNKRLNFICFGAVSHVQLRLAERERYSQTRGNVENVVDGWGASLMGGYAPCEHTCGAISFLESLQNPHVPNPYVLWFCFRVTCSFKTFSLVFSFTDWTVITVPVRLCLANPTDNLSFIAP